MSLLQNQGLFGADFTTKLQILHHEEHRDDSSNPLSTGLCYAPCNHGKLSALHPGQWRN